MLAFPKTPPEQPVPLPPPNVLDGSLVLGLSWAFLGIGAALVLLCLAHLATRRVRQPAGSSSQPTITEPSTSGQILTVGLLALLAGTVTRGLHQLIT